MPVWTTTRQVSSRGDWLVRLAEKSLAVAPPNRSVMDFAVLIQPSSVHMAQIGVTNQEGS